MSGDFAAFGKKKKLQNAQQKPDMLGIDSAIKGFVLFSPKAFLDENSQNITSLVPIFY